MNIGNYKLIRRIGAGGMGIVFRALDPVGRPVAIKMIGSRAEIHATVNVGKVIQSDAALNLERRMMLVREARLAMELRHPNIVRTFDYGQHGGLLYIVSEFLEGRSLDKALPIHGSMPLHTKLSILQQVCQGLEHAHQQQLMHRDIKPANIFVLQDLSVKVLDFGVAARMRELIGGQQSIVGTPHYMAPEVVSGSNAYDARVDIWSAGVTLYVLLTGMLPFHSPSIGQLFQKIAHSPLPRLHPSLPNAPELEQILHRAMAKNPSDRYQSAGAFARDLERFKNRMTERTISPGGVSQPELDDEWLTATVATLPVSPKAQVSKAGEVVTTISGRIAASGGGHSVRFLRYRRAVEPIAAIAMIFGGIPALFAVVGYLVFSPPHANLFHVLREAAGIGHYDAPLVLIRLPFALCGLFVPLSLLVGFVLGLLATREKFHGIPGCHSCTVRMKHLSRIDRFSYTDLSRKHASSDCLAALKENLWDDAAKLLSMHGELFSPKTKVSAPVVRYYLDFYICRVCGDEAALLTSEEARSRILRPREEFEGAYKAKNVAAAVPSAFQRRRGSIEAVKRAAALAMESVDAGAVRVMLIGSIFLCTFYIPLIPHLVRVFRNVTEITIKSDPPGQWITVDGNRVQTPGTFWWTFTSNHALGGLAERQINGIPYRFRSVTGPYSTYSFNSPRDRVACDHSDVHSGECRIFVLQDADGANTPRIPSYTINFVRSDSPRVAESGK